MLNRTQAPPITEATEYNLKLKPYNLFYLDNGVPVYVIDAGAQDVLQIEMVFYAGNFYEKNKAVASATNFLLKNGTSTRNAFQLNETFDYFGASCSRACYNETATITLHTLSKHTDKLLPLINDMLTNATFLEEELAILKQNSKQRLKVNLLKCEFIAARKIDQFIYGENHPYGTFNNDEDYDALTSDQLKTFYNTYYLNGQCAIFVAGKLPTNIIELLNENFGKLNISKPTFIVEKIKTVPLIQKKHIIQNDEKAVQGAIRIAQPFPNRHHQDFKKVIVLNTVYGGYFGSRLMSNIREEKGYTYGIYSYLQNHMQESAWLISTEAGKDVCDATIEEIYKEMKLIRDTPIDNEELSLVRNYMIGGILGDLDGPFQIIAKWKNIILNNLDEKYFYDSVDAIKNTSAEELQALAQKYLLPEKFYELVVY
ncbi:MAG: pitrilysin family protein [Ferruginibacter sp.]|nr:insulinase family protein [Ferruginibacter sp.]NOU38838.1 insulinase family protein [Ferruginibacter sp.]